MATAYKRWFDPEPLLEFIARRAKEHDRSKQAATSGTRWVCHVFGVNSNMARQIHRWQHGARLSWWYADKVAGQLGVHPAWIWSDWYDLEEGVEDIDEVDDEGEVAA